MYTEAYIDDNISAIVCCYMDIATVLRRGQDGQTLQFSPAPFQTRKENKPLIQPSGGDSPQEQERWEGTYLNSSACGDRAPALQPKNTWDCSKQLRNAPLKGTRRLLLVRLPDLELN